MKTIIKVTAAVLVLTAVVQVGAADVATPAKTSTRKATPSPTTASAETASTVLPNSNATNLPTTNHTPTFGQRAYLGIHADAVPPVVSAQLPHLLRPGSGVVIVGIDPASPAAGQLLLHDVVVLYDDQRLFHEVQLQGLIGEDRPGRTVKLSLIRNGQRHVVETVLGVFPIEPVAVPASNNVDRQAAPLQAPGQPPIDKPMSGRSSGAVALSNAEGSVTITETDGIYRAHVAPRGQSPYGIQGNRRQLEEQLHLLPPGLAQQVRHVLADRKTDGALPWTHSFPPLYLQ